MTSTLWLDYETRSHCDLVKRGLYNYADDNSTEILIASYAIDDGPIKRWEPWRGRGMPLGLDNALHDSRVTIKAHNASFERLITKACLGIDVPLKRWYCTSYQARMCGYPPNLDNAARMADPSWRKDERGGALIRRYSIPPFENDPEGLTQFGVYCDQDVNVMRNLSKCLLPLSGYDLKVWAANEVINDRGLPIDTELCEYAARYIEQELEALERRMVELTGTKARGRGLAQWVAARLTDEQLDLIQRDDKITLDSAARGALMETELAPDVLEALEISNAASLASTAKFKKMADRASSDGRLRGAFVCAGAPATGRYASWGVQLHNFPRTSAKEPEALRKKIKRRESVTPAELKSMLRPAICAGPGKYIARCDWNAIEARGLPWLVNTPDSRKYLEAFNDPSRDIYIEQAEAAGLGRARQEGKVVVLSLGYGGGEGALSKMARAYGVSIPEPGRVVSRWRSSNGWATDWWRNLMSAATRSRSATEPINVGRVSFVGPGVMRLPSGRYVVYPRLQLDEEEQVVYNKAAKKPKAGEPWPFARLWHGVIAENATQAACCDLLRDLTVREAHRPLIGHVHDEVIAEVSNKKEGERWLQRAMTTTNKWAEGLPLRAEAVIEKRFGK